MTLYEPRSPIETDKYDLVVYLLAEETLLTRGRIFLDWLRNQRGSTAVMPYSARAREGAPVAAPISWDELDQFGGGNAFTIRDLDQLLERAKSKALAGWGKAKQSLPDA